MTLTCALNDAYIWVDTLNALVRLCACALMLLWAFSNCILVSDLPPLKWFAIQDLYSSGFYLSPSSWARFGKQKKEEDMFNTESYAELLNASKRQRLTDDMSLMYRNTILVTLASEEHYQLKCRFIEKHAKHSLHPKPGESTHPLHNARRRIWVKGESVTRTQSHERCKHKLIISLSN